MQIPLITFWLGSQHFARGHVTHRALRTCVIKASGFRRGHGPGNDWPNHLVCIEHPHHNLRSLNGGNHGRSTNIGIF